MTAWLASHPRATGWVVLVAAIGGVLRAVTG